VLEVLNKPNKPDIVIINTPTTPTSVFLVELTVPFTMSQELHCELVFNMVSVKFLMHFFSMWVLRASTDLKV
jgi:hypothetical protein